MPYRLEYQMINWTVRLKSKQFWIGLVGIIGTMVSVIANSFGLTIDANAWVTALDGVVTAIFAVLALVGVVADPTTSGLSDSTQAMGYTEPKKD